MRIVLANKFLYPRGGAERAVLTLGAALEQRGHEVFWFGMEHPDNQVEGERVELVRRRDYRASGPGRFRDAATMLYSWEARRRFGRLVDRARPDLVHLHNIYHQLTPSILDAARSRGLPLLMTLHDYKLACPRYDMLRDGRPCDACVEEGPVACVRYRCGGSLAHSILLAAESALHRVRGSYDAVQRFLAPSRFLMRVLLRAGWEPQRLQYLPNFAQTRDEPAHEEPSRDAADQERFVYAGRLSTEKGLRTLLGAIRKLDRGTWVVCGRGPLEPELRRAEQTLPPGRMLMRGHLEPQQLWGEMRRSRFTVLPSECFENAPLALLESMALARPVLASDIGGVPELVEDGVNGVLVPPRNVDAWVTALQDALGSPEHVRRMGATARELIRERFDLEHHVRSIETIYREVAA
jgi:glycosyltransferase involved in cell wall biosynthesis